MFIMDLIAKEYFLRIANVHIHFQLLYFPPGSERDLLVPATS